jgi:hypothetical protein
LKKEIKDDYDLQLNLWVINHFKVLPTDDRFKRLTQNQKSLLLQGYLESPDSSSLKLYFLEEQKKDISFSEDEEKALLDSGYDTKQLEKIKKEIAKLSSR